MRRVCALLGLLALMGVACGRYGPPIRSRPAPEAAATAAADAGRVEAADDERERSK